MTPPIKFLSALWTGGQYSYYWTAPKRLSYWLPVDKISSSYCPNGGQNVYFGINPVTQIPPKNAKNELKPPEAVRSQNNYISAINCLFAEFDFKIFGHTETIRNHLQNFPFPSVVIASGGGYHFYWLLDKTFFINTSDDLNRAKIVQSNWVNHLDSDNGSKDLARVLRVPGTHNYKPQYAPNYPLVHFVKEDYSIRYSLIELEAISKPKSIPECLPLSQPICPGKPDDVNYYQCQVLNAIKKMIQDAPDGEKHGILLKAARLMGGYIAGGIITELDAIAALEYEISQKANVKNLKSAYRTINAGIEYGKEYPITLEQKLAEREMYLAQSGIQTIKPPKQEKNYWSKQYVQMWERTR